MTQPAKVQEPSMEEILASIRRIIADDEAKPPVAEKPSSPPAAAPVKSEKPPAAEKPTEDDTDDVAETKKGDKPQSYVTVHGKEARLHVVSDEPGITLHRQASSAFASGSAARSGWRWAPPRALRRRTSARAPQDAPVRESRPCRGLR